MEKDYKFNRVEVVKILNNKKMSRGELARNSDIDTAEMSRYFHKKRIPPMKNILKMADFLGVEPNVLIMKNTKKENEQQLNDICQKISKNNLGRQPIVISEETINKLIDLYCNKNLSIKKCSEIVGIGTGTIIRRLKERGVTFANRQTITKNKRIEILSQYIQGKITKEEAYKKLGLENNKYQLFYYYLKEYENDYKKNIE